MNTRKLMAEKYGLAKTYAEDGALFSAARVLRQLADELEARGAAANAELERLVEGK